DPATRKFGKIWLNCLGAALTMKGSLDDAPSRLATARLLSREQACGTFLKPPLASGPCGYVASRHIEEARMHTPVAWAKEPTQERSSPVPASSLQVPQPVERPDWPGEDAF